MHRFFNRTRKSFFGVVHLLPLPGSPRWRGNMDAVIQRAVQDAQAYADGGADGLVLENFNDVPFTKGAVAPETVAAFARAAGAIRDKVKLPLGFNVLRNDARTALGLSVACGGEFIRVNVHAGAMLADQGVIEGQAHDTMRVRRQLCPGVKILADVHVKHAVTIGNWSIEQAAQDTVERGLADALIVSGTGTGVAAELADVRRVRRVSTKVPVLLGSGVTVGNLNPFLPLVDGVIVGTSLKIEGKVMNPVDPKRVASLARALRGKG